MSLIETMPWGYPCEVPSGTKIVWGARAIFNPRDVHPMDLLPDRQGFHGDAGEWLGLKYLLNNGVLEAAQARLTAYVRKGTVRRDEEREVVLYESTLIKVVGNTNASHGYFYVTAFIKPVDYARRVPDGVEKELSDFAEGEFRWSGPRIPAVGEVVALGGNYPNPRHRGKQVCVLAHAVAAKHLFLAVRPVEPSEDAQRERALLLSALRGEGRAGVSWPDDPDSCENRVQSDPADCLWLPREPVSWVMGREWEELPKLLESVETPHGTCTLYRTADNYILHSPKTGTETLSIAHTDAQRLAAHWKGFVQVDER
jgi:hypothetical protein